MSECSERSTYLNDVLVQVLRLLEEHFACYPAGRVELSPTFASLAVEHDKQTKRRRGEEPTPAEISERNNSYVKMYRVLIIFVKAILAENTRVHKLIMSVI